MFVKKFWTNISLCNICGKSVSDTNNFILQVQAIVDSYKGANMNISKTCKQISETLLVKVDSKKTYENVEFEETQKRHRGAIQDKLTEMHKTIIGTMKTTYEVFRTDGHEVSAHVIGSFMNLHRVTDSCI